MTERCPTLGRTVYWYAVERFAGGFEQPVPMAEWNDHHYEAFTEARKKGVRWGLHVEPMLGPIDLSYQHPGANGAAMGDVSWIVVGAEQGPGARPFELDWARSLRDQCRAASVPFWFKSDSRRREPPADLCVRETPWR